MKIFLLAAAFLLLAASAASAQKTCMKSPTAAIQTCTVTLSWTASVVDATHDAPALYTPRRSDGGATMTAIGNVAANVLSFQNVFNDTGGVSHCWDVVATNVGGSSPPATAVCWTTPALQKSAPAAPPNTTLSNLPLANLDS